MAHSRGLKLGYGPKIGQKWAKNGYFQNFEKSFKNYRYCLKETWKVLYWAKILLKAKNWIQHVQNPSGGNLGVEICCNSWWLSDLIVPAPSLNSKWPLQYVYGLTSTHIFVFFSLMWNRIINVITRRSPKFKRFMREDI